jgi:uncharacterized protein (DUF362 family)
MDRFFYRLESFLRKQVSRKRFLMILFGGLLAFIAQSTLLKLAFAKSETSKGRPKKNIKGSVDLVEVEGPDPYLNTVKAIESMGGMAKFVKAGSVVLIKPNIAWDRTPEQAANTDPNVVCALIDMCYKAGAKRVNLFDVTCNDEKSCYERSGIAKAARDKGAFVYFPNHWNVVKASFPYDSLMEGWPIIRDAVDCDTFINVPVLKHHGLTGLTLSMKNLMGVCSGTRGLLHMDIGRKLADLTDFISPELNVIDATRVLAANGPTGGDPDDIIAMNKVIVSTDATLADSYAAGLMKRPPESISYIKAAINRGFGNSDVSKANILRLKA